MTASSGENSPKNFGECYYAEEPHGSAAAGPLFLGWNEVEEALALGKHEVGGGLKASVEQAVKSWNVAVRDQLRDETRYKFSAEGDVRSVRIDVKDGFPRPFRDLVDGLDVWILGLLRKRAGLTLGRECLQHIVRYHGEVDHWMKSRGKPGAPSADTLEAVGGFFADVEALLADSGYEREMQRLTEDVLGAYFFHRGRIEIYWMAIVIMAAVANVSVEGLTVTVLAHELAHAYTHLGRDIDGREWDTMEFGRADLEIVEGLAQFYTGLVTARLKRRSVDPHAAYKAFLAFQGGPYRAHLEWGAEGETVGEIVRGAMNDMRVKKIGKHGDFLRLLGDYRRRLGQEATG